MPQLVPGGDMAGANDPAGGVLGGGLGECGSDWERGRGGDAGEIVVEREGDAGEV